MCPPECPIFKLDQNHILMLRDDIGLPAYKYEKYYFKENVAISPVLCFLFVSIVILYIFPVTKMECS